MRLAKQIQIIQESGVIKPSKSPWATPVMLVRKRDGLFRFFIDYGHFNAIKHISTPTH